MVLAATRPHPCSGRAGFSGTCAGLVGEFDANDVLYQFAALDAYDPYDPAPRLETINATAANIT
jgi:hypothetical protein